MVCVCGVQGLFWDSPEMDKRRMSKTDAQPTSQEHLDKGRDQEEEKKEEAQDCGKTTGA